MGKSTASRVGNRTGVLFALTCLLLVPLLAGCTMWEPAGSPREVIADQRPTAVRVHYEDGRQSVLNRPLLRNDSIVGVAEWCAGRTGACPGEQVEPLAGIELVEVQRVSIDRTAVAIVGSVAAVLVIGLLSWASASG